MLIDMPVGAEFFQDGPESLIDFYKKLGFDPERHYLNPTKIQINYNEAEKCLENLMKCAKGDERISLSFLWLNKGPSASPDIPKGKVKLMEGWIQVVNDDLRAV